MKKYLILTMALLLTACGQDTADSTVEETPVGGGMIATPLPEEVEVDEDLFDDEEVETETNDSGAEAESEGKSEGEDAEVKEAAEGAATESVYVVQRGDTLGELARKFEVSLQDLILWNGIIDPNLIHTGQTLIVSGGSSTWEPGAEGDLTQQLKGYIQFGQDGVSPEDRLNWHSGFLSRLPAAAVERLHRSFLAEGGTEDDMTAFARYVTRNAPLLNNWRALSVAAVEAEFGVRITRVEPLQIIGDDNSRLYQLFILKDGLESAFVNLDARTGYFWQ